MTGHLEKVSKTVYVIISKKRPGDLHPKYFLCTDITLSAQQALSLYQKRWPVEVDNLYLKEVLGLGDFRLQSFEAIERWFAVVTLAINYLQCEHLQAYLRTQQPLPLAEILRQHRLRHFQGLLRTVFQAVLRTGRPIIDHLELHWYANRRPGWCLTTKLPMRDASGEIIGVVGISRDLRAPGDNETIPASLASTAQSWGWNLRGLKVRGNSPKKRWT